MKEKIINLLERKNNTILKINKYITLRRQYYKKKETTTIVDKITVESSITHFRDGVKEIESRDWRTILKEVNEFQKEMFEKASEKYAEQIESQYL